MRSIRVGLGSYRNLWAFRVQASGFHVGSWGLGILGLRVWGIKG